jgi:hypothetical protein
MKNTSYTPSAQLTLATHGTLLFRVFRGIRTIQDMFEWEDNLEFWSKKLEANNNDTTAVNRVKHLLSVYLREMFRTGTDGNATEVTRLALKVYDSAIRPRRNKTSLNYTLPLNQEVRGGYNHRIVLIKTMLQYLSLEIGNGYLTPFIGDGLFNDSKPGEKPTLFPKRFANNFKWLLGHSVKPGAFTDPLLPKLTPTFTDLLENSDVFTMGHYRSPFCRGGKHHFTNTSVQTGFSNNKIQKRQTFDEAVNFIKNVSGVKNTNIVSVDQLTDALV